MNERDKEKLYAEQARGEEYQRAWDTLVSPFFEVKRIELFEAFQQLPTTDREGLLAVKLQSNALRALEDEFRHYINTGKLASQSLKEEGENG